MLTLTIPREDAHYPAAAFAQNGQHLCSGPREYCEQVARDNNGLYCWIADGRPVIRFDFETLED